MLNSHNWWAPFPPRSEELKKNWLNSRRKLYLGRRKWLLRRWRKPVTITVVCCTAYLSWFFSIICCPQWLGRFVRHNCLGCSKGSIFVRFILHGFYFLWVSLPPHQIKSIENLIHGDLCHEDFLIQGKYMYKTHGTLSIAGCAHITFWAWSDVVNVHSQVFE